MQRKSDTHSINADNLKTVEKTEATLNFSPKINFKISKDKGKDIYQNEKAR